MIDQSFIFLPKVGEKTEKQIWQSGIRTWSDFLSKPCIKGFSAARKEVMDWQLKQADHHLKNDNHSYFASYLPSSAQWRLWNHFKDDAVFLDIETSGYYGDVTVVGFFDGENVVSLVRGFNLDKYNFERALSKAKMIVTYNGRSFDIPVLRRYFNVDPMIPHVDLRFVAQKLGYFGGLKKLEKQMGIARPAHVADMAGEQAVALWQLWKSTREREHLDRLIDYNREDIVNLLPLASRLIPDLWARTRF